MQHTTACTGASQGGIAPAWFSDQHADETLERTQDRAVQHDRRTALVVLVHILAPRRTGMEKST